MYDFAYVCRECGEAFLPSDKSDWDALRKMHKSDCPDATFARTPIEQAF